MNRLFFRWEGVIATLFLFILSMPINAQKMCVTPDPAPVGSLSPGITTQALIASTKWDNGRNITVSFIDRPTDKIRRKIEQYASVYENHANISFNFVTDNDSRADIRIGLDTTGTTSWSAIGRNSRNGRRTSMNFGWFDVNTTESDFRSTILHEFGHALGMHHEHHHPDQNICWDRPKVYRAYAGEPNNWDRATVDNNLFQLLDHSDLSNASVYDPASIMHYSIDANLTTCNYSVEGATELSPMDISYLGAMYPLPNRKFLGPVTNNYNWSAGWTNMQTYTVNNMDYLILVKPSGVGKDGNNIHIHRMDKWGSIGPKVYAVKGQEGWTTVKHFTVNRQHFMLFMKDRRQSGSTVAIHRINSNGTLGQGVYSEKWSDGWTDAAFYQAGDGHTYFLHYKKRGTASNGMNMIIRKMNPDGSIGKVIDQNKWTVGWTAIQPFTISGKDYIFLLKKNGYNNSGHNAMVHEIKHNGQIGPHVNSYKWTQGWDTAEFCTRGNKTFLYLMKSGDGSVDVDDVLSDGRIGATVYDNKGSWSSGWTDAQFYTSRGQPYLLLLKERTGKVDIHSIY